MITFDEALALLSSHVRPLATERIALTEASGRVLAEPVYAALSSPRRTVSAMDGYALRNADASVGVDFKIVGASFAGGDLPPAVGTRNCIRIFTGAAMPFGADRVVMQENCRTDGEYMTITSECGPGWHVRSEASDFAKGDLLLPVGTVLEPRAIVTLAGADQATAIVHSRPRLAIIATGDELVPPGSARANPLKVPESVSFGVAALAEQFGAKIEARFSGGDDLKSLRQLSKRALAVADVIVVTGGASVGERDHAKAMFAERDLELLFAKVSIKPGKPVWIGRSQGRWIVGLPGNPTSAMVTARLFLVPLLALLQGRKAGDVLRWICLPIAAPFPDLGNRTTFVRARLCQSGLVPLTNQDSGAQAPLGEARWLVRRDIANSSTSPSALAGTLLALDF